MIFTLPLDNGKYKVHYEDNKITATRHGEEWRDLTGDNLIFFMLMHIMDAECRVHDLNLKLQKADPTHEYEYRNK